MSEVLSKRLVGDFFVVRDLSDWTTVKLTLNLKYNAIQLPVASLRVICWGSTNVVLLIGSSFGW